jgi:DNA polymerase III subunit beta
MELEIDQARFLSALALAQTVADKRSTMPVLANVLLRATSDGHLVCAATDMMIALTEMVPALVKSTGSVTVGGRHLHGVVRTLPSGSLKLRGLDNHWVQIVSGRSEFKLMGMPESDFPELPDAGKGKSPSRGALTFTDVPGHVFSDLIAKTQFSVSTDEARVNLNGVLFECDGAMASMVSTDGHRLTRYSCRLPGPKLDKGIIIPRKGMLEIRRMLDRVQGDVGIAVGEQHLFVRADELSMSVKLNNVQFPPYKAVIPTNHQRRVTVSREELLGALRRAEVMAPEKTATVRLQLAKGKLELTADNPDLGVAHQELPIDYDGESLVAGFNAHYLIEILDAIDGPEVALEFQGELDPCVIKPVDGPDLLGVVMPMRI